MSPADEKRAIQLLSQSLATNEGRIQLFRRLARYEDTQGFEPWCVATSRDPKDESAFAEWSLIHHTYMVAWKALGSARFFKWLRLGYTGLSVRGTA